jgi:hypothetical protein
MTITPEMDAILEQAKAEAKAREQAKPNGSGTEPTNSAPLFDPWQPFVAPAFPLEILPPTLRYFVVTQSEVIGADKSALAMAVLAAVGGAIDHEFALKLMRYGSWWAHPRLWVLLIGPSAYKKTPIFDAATGVLDRLQRSAWVKYKNDRDEYVKAGGDPKEFEMPEPPRYVAYDITVEKLGIILGEQDRGILIKRDELAGWIGQMEKYATGRASCADRAFWLKAYDGGPFTVDRVSREDVRINNLSCSVIGGIQPARLNERQGLTTDGLLQRFLPVMVNGSSLPQDKPGPPEAASYTQLMQRLVKLSPRKLFLADDAFKPLEEMRERLYDLEQASGSLHEGFQGFVGKLAGVAGTLALILTITGDPDRAEGTQVQSGVIEDVTALVFDFILPHGFEFYRTAESAAGGDRLQRLASWILTSAKTRILPSDMTVNVADMRGLTLWDVNQRVSPLVAGGWLTANERGPLARSWTVNPQVSEFFRERTREEEKRKAAITELLKSLKAQKEGKS